MGRLLLKNRVCRAIGEGSLRTLGALVVNVNPSIFPFRLSIRQFLPKMRRRLAQPHTFNPFSAVTQIKHHRTTTSRRFDHWHHRHSKRPNAFPCKEIAIESTVSGDSKGPSVYGIDTIEQLSPPAAGTYECVA